MAARLAALALVLPSALCSDVPMTLVANITFPSLGPEGIEFDPTNNRLVLGSIFSGPVTGVDLSSLSAGSVAQLTSSQIHVYFPGGAPLVGSVIGIQTDAANPCYLYGAVSEGFQGTRMGVATFDMCNDALLYFTDLSSLTISTCFANDLVKVPNGDIYVTDSLGNQVIRVVNQNSNSPSFSSVFTVDGFANGIDLVTPTRLIVASAAGLEYWDIGSSLTTGTLLGDPAGSIASLAGSDGLFYDATSSTLLVTHRVANDGYVSVVATSDGWTKGTLSVRFATNCFATTSTVAGSDLYTTCPTNFGSGPYQISLLRDFRSHIPSCAGWCNPYTCRFDACTGCSSCAELSSGSSCADWCNPYTCRLDACTGCSSCAELSLGSSCAGWCNPYTCRFDSCTGCSSCTELSSGTYCAGWCNSYTCGATLCSGCTVCTALSTGTYCASWCNEFTTSFPVCAGCQPPDLGSGAWPQT